MTVLKYILILIYVSVAACQTDTSCQDELNGCMAIFGPNVTLGTITLQFPLHVILGNTTDSVDEFCIKYRDEVKDCIEAHLLYCNYGAISAEAWNAVQNLYDNTCLRRDFYVAHVDCIREGFGEAERDGCTDILQSNYTEGIQGTWELCFDYENMIQCVVDVEIEHCGHGDNSDAVANWINKVMVDTHLITLCRRLFGILGGATAAPVTSEDRGLTEFGCDSKKWLLQLEQCNLNYQATLQAILFEQQSGFYDTAAQLDRAVCMALESHINCSLAATEQHCNQSVVNFYFESLMGEIYDIASLYSCTLDGIRPGLVTTPPLPTAPVCFTEKVEHATEACFQKYLDYFDVLEKRVDADFFGTVEEIYATACGIAEDYMICYWYALLESCSPEVARDSIQDILDELESALTNINCVLTLPEPTKKPNLDTKPTPSSPSKSSPPALPNPTKVSRVSANNPATSNAPSISANLTKLVFITILSKLTNHLIN